MTVQHTRTTALKDSADKNTLMQEMIAKCSQSSVAQELSVAHHNYEERTTSGNWGGAAMTRWILSIDVRMLLMEIILATITF